MYPPVGTHGGHLRKQAAAYSTAAARIRTRHRLQSAYCTYSLDIVTGTLPRVLTRMDRAGQQQSTLEGHGKSYSCETDHIHYRDDFIALHAVLFTVALGRNFFLVSIWRTVSCSSPGHCSVFTIQICVAFSHGLLESTEPTDPAIVSLSLWYTLLPSILAPFLKPQLFFFLFVFLIYAIFSYFMYYKRPYISGIDPSTSLNPQSVNMAPFQGMILPQSDHVCSFTFPQTCTLRGEWAGHGARHRGFRNQTDIALPLHLVRKRQDKLRTALST